MKAMKALPGVITYIALFVLLPRLLIPKIPPMAVAIFGTVGSVLASLALMGLVLAVLHAAKTYAKKDTLAELSANVLSEIANLAIVLFFIGFGSPLSFGKGQRPIPIGQDSVVFYDFRIVVTLLIAISALKIAARILEYFGKKQEEPKGAVNPTSQA